MDILNIASQPTFDNRITKIETHTYNPYANSTFGNNDEIRIPIQQQDLYVLPSESFLYIEGKIASDGATATAAPLNVSLDNNFPAFLFEEIRYELDGVEIDRCRNPGVTTTLKNYASLSEEKSRRLAVAGWNINRPEMAAKEFNFCIPLNILLGFCEDYKQIIINARHELILIRSRSDFGGLRANDETLKPTVVLSKIQWKMAHVSLEELNKLALLRILESGRSLSMNFRSWDLYEYPMLQETDKHSWTVKAASYMEKPRYIIFAMRTGKKNLLNAGYTKFHHNNLINFRLYLNSECYPYDDMHLNFDIEKYSILYDMYSKFRNSYYGSGEPLLNYEQFTQYGPFVIIDCSRQNDTIKSATVDVKIEFECGKNISKDTSAYCLIIHDRIVEYNPLTNIVRKIV